MTIEISQASLQVPEASPTASSSETPLVYTPPSEPSALSSSDPSPNPPPRRPSPLNLTVRGSASTHKPPVSGDIRYTGTGVEGTFDSDAESDDSEEHDNKRSEKMATETRPPLHRPTDGRSGQPLLLKDERGRPSYESPAGSSRPAFVARRSTFRSRSPDFEAQSATKKKYMYAAFFLGVSLVSFVIQTETASYIQINLGWKKAYCMLYLTHGSWSLLWPATLLVSRIQKRKIAWPAFWRRHKHILRTTAQMVRSQDIHLETREAHESPIPYILKTTAFVTSALTIAGGSWYVAVNLTSPSDLTAIYNCSAFFAYAFSIPLLGDRFRFDKAFSVAVAIAGVLVVAYGDSGTHSDVGGGVDGGKLAATEPANRALGNVVIGIGSVLYGLYEVLYKRLACPPEGTSAGRGMVFAMTFGSLIGSFTLLFLWIPLPILHFTGLEPFELPKGEAAWMMLISVLTNATFSGSFLVLISLTSPVLSSVAALLTIFLVAIVDTIKPGGERLSVAAIIGGLLIIGAFLLLSWSTYREMNEERRKRIEDEDVLSEDDE